MPEQTNTKKYSLRRFETKKANLKIIRFDSIDQTNVRHTTTGNTHARTHGFAGSGGGDGNGLVEDEEV